MVKELIGYAIKKDFDIGRLSKKSRIGTIKVDKDFWIKYVNLRHEFEIMHEALLNKIGDIFKRNKLLK